ncbi:MAG: LPS export ABC transporter periplasmic protein LptC, partial [Spirochaetaceae bacterium]|nr:LPS export ABC transporter periplasmic protein LptC [Spirochaetaceae bacterium]
MMVRFLLLVLSVFSLAACSLSYKVEEPQVDHIPELVFTEVEYLSYEDGRVRMQMGSTQLEQYRDDNALYGKDVSFSTYNQDGDLSAQGHSQMISVNSTDQQYSFLGDVFIDSLQEDLVVRAQSLHWDGIDQQLTSGVRDTLELVRGSSSG